jgi:hypothetical protein
MLKDKEQVIDYSYEAKNDFGNIEAILHRKTATGERKNSADQVQQNIKYGPTFSALPFVVPIGRGSVLNQSYD